MLLSFLSRYRLALRSESCLGGGLLGPGRVATMAMALSSAKTPMDGGEEEQTKLKYIEPSVLNRWIPDEDNILRAGIDRHGFNWLLIANTYLPQRNANSCRMRWVESLNPELKSGLWSAEEDARLIKAVKAFGVGHWAKIASYMNGRTAVQCRIRYVRKLDPSLKKGTWTNEEDALVLAGVAQYGRDWVAVAASLPGRGTHHIQKRYDALCRKGSMRTPWSDEETNRLREAVEKHGTRDWSVVVEKVGRNADACKRKWHYLTLNKATGSVGWNEEEDTLLLQGVQKHGTVGKWAAIAAPIPGKAGKECKIRWECRVSRVLNKTPWTKEEDAIIVKMREDGVRWDRIFHRLPGRDKDAIRMRCKELGREINPGWTAAEVEALKTALLPYEGKKRKPWKKIAEQMPSKTAQQCLNYFRSNIL